MNFFKRERERAKGVVARAVPTPKEESEKEARKIREDSLGDEKLFLMTLQRARLGQKPNSHIIKPLNYKLFDHLL